MSDIIKWDKKFELGIEEIDKQHRKWVEILNKFIAARKEKREKEILKEILKEIVDYTQYHFKTEETHMAENGFELLTKHKEQHKILVNRISDIISTLNYNEEKAIITLEILMKNWVLKHILTNDKIYGEYLKHKKNK